MSSGKDLSLHVPAMGFPDTHYLKQFLQVPLDSTLPGYIVFPGIDSGSLYGFLQTVCRHRGIAAGCNDIATSADRFLILVDNEAGDRQMVHDIAEADTPSAFDIRRKSTLEESSEILFCKIQEDLMSYETTIEDSYCFVRETTPQSVG